MKCDLCRGKKKVRRAGEEETIDCPRCDGSGVVLDEAEKAVVEGKAEFLSPPFQKWIQDIRAVLRDVQKTWPTR